MFCFFDALPVDLLLKIGWLDEQQRHQYTCSWFVAVQKMMFFSIDGVISHLFMVLSDSFYSPAARQIISRFTCDSCGFMCTKTRQFTDTAVEFVSTGSTACLALSGIREPLYREQHLVVHLSITKWLIFVSCSVCALLVGWQKQHLANSKPVPVMLRNFVFNILRKN